MKILFLMFVSLTLFIQLFAQPINVSDNLTLNQISDNCYVHTQGNNNGLVYVNGNESIIVSTPESDLETQNLIDYVRKELNTKIVAYIIDRWHTDAMEGLDVVQKNGIPTYAYEKTRRIAKIKGLPVPDKGFDPKVELKVGKGKVIAHFLGEAHTNDGIVVWVPDEKVLFGGNGIRNYNGWVGNIGNANLGAWSETAMHIKKEYGTAKVVVPGHGKYGGVELIDYTIQLYDTTCRHWVLNQDEVVKLPDFEIEGDVLIHADTITADEGNRIMENARIFICDNSKCVKIESPNLVYNSKEKRVDSDTGQVEIYDLVEGGGKLRISLSYQRLIVIKRDDSIGLVVILKAFWK